MTAKRLLIGLALVLGLSVHAQAQQSTTGPVPPPGIDRGLSVNKATAVTIPGVPSYIWHHGCGPTAVGMVMGYWDSEFTGLVPGDASTQTAAVNAMMTDDSGFPRCDGSATPDHYQDYSCPKDYAPNPLQPDRSETGGAHTDNCVGDFMYTSQSAQSNYYGWSWFSHVPRSFTEYVALYQPSLQAAAVNYSFWEYSWDEYKAEIDGGYPVVLLVDTDGNGGTDHFITAIGYDESAMRYICYDTWDHSLHSYLWRELSSGNSWGIYGVTTFRVMDPNQPIIAAGPVSCDCGLVSIGDCVMHYEPIVVENVGGGTLSGEATVDAPFIILSGASYSLAAGESQEVWFGFCPTESGTFNRVLSLTGGGGAIVTVTGQGCGCAYQCDFDEDGFLTAIDLAALIDVLFAGRPDIQDPLCTSSRSDFDCSGFADAIDMAGLIDHLFTGGEGPCDPCVQ